MHYLPLALPMGLELCWITLARTFEPFARINGSVFVRIVAICSTIFKMDRFPVLTSYTMNGQDHYKFIKNTSKITFMNSLQKLFVFWGIKRQKFKLMKFLHFPTLAIFFWQPSDVSHFSSKQLPGCSCQRGGRTFSVSALVCNEVWLMGKQPSHRTL